MYKLLIVDDEDVEREGMADFIQWEKYGISLAGTAWNGVEGYEEIQNQMPDIVITDIKMPVMNGIELIRKTREDFPDIVFIVLSGYGEYEYTSRAVELGVRHYILKPCDEAKIVEVIGKVTEELKVREEKKRKEVDMRTQVKRLAPRAREQMFRNVLLNREDIHKDFEAYLGGCGIFSKEVFLLAFHKETWFDYLEQFVVSNIITELLGSGHVLLVTSIRNDVLLLLDGRVFDEIQPVIVKVKKEYEKFDSSPLQTAVSGRGSWGQIHGLYEEVSGLLKMGKIEADTDALWHGFYKDINREELMLINYRALRAAKSYDAILFELYLGFVKMRLRGDLAGRKEAAILYVLDMLYEDEDNERWMKEKLWNGEGRSGEGSQNAGDDRELLKLLADYISEKQGFYPGGDKEERRMRDILLGIYQNISRQELSIQWLTKEVLYMNQDYFGRVFFKCMKQKYSSYLLNVRIELAKRLIWYFPEIKLSQIAEEVGYPADGQYFSKTFRKSVGMSPSEYKDYIQKQA